MLEEARPSPPGGSGVDPELFETVADRVNGKGQQVEGCEHHGEVLLAVTEIVFEVVAVGFEDVEAFVLDLLAGSGASHDLGDGVSRNGQ